MAYGRPKPTMIAPVIIFRVTGVVVIVWSLILAVSRKEQLSIQSKSKASSHAQN